LIQLGKEQTMSKRILVIANDAAAGNELQSAVQGPPGATQVLVIAPEAARAQLRTCVARLKARGIRADGAIGDTDPLQATLDAARLFPPDEIVISTHRSSRLTAQLVEKLARHYDGPILHVAVGEARLLAAA
jgi:hypothetical protein